MKIPDLTKAAQALKMPIDHLDRGVRERVRKRILPALPALYSFYSFYSFHAMPYLQG